MEPNESGESRLQLPDSTFLIFERNRESIVEGTHVLGMSREKNILENTFTLSESMRKSLDVGKSQLPAQPLNDSSPKTRRRLVQPISVASPNLNLESILEESSALLDETGREENSRRGPVKNVSVDFTLNSTASTRDGSVVVGKRNPDPKFCRLSVKLPSLNSTEESSLAFNSVRDDVSSQETSFPSRKMARRSVKLPSLDSSDETQNLLSQDSSKDVEGIIAESQPETSTHGESVPKVNGATVDISLESLSRSDMSQEESVPVRSMARRSVKLPSLDSTNETTTAPLTQELVDEETVPASQPKSLPRSSTNETFQVPRVNGASVNFTFDSMSRSDIVSSQEASVPVRTMARRSVKLPTLDSTDETTRATMTQELVDEGTVPKNQPNGLPRCSTNEKCQVPSVNAASVDFTFDSLSRSDIVSSQETSVPVRTLARRSVKLPSLDSTDETTRAPLTQELVDDETVALSQPESMPRRSTREDARVPKVHGASVNFTFSRSDIVSSQETSIPGRTVARRSVKVPSLDSSVETTRTPLTQELDNEETVTQRKPSTHKASPRLKGATVDFTLDSLSHNDAASSQDTCVSVRTMACQSVKLPSLDLTEEDSVCNTQDLVPSQPVYSTQETSLRTNFKGASVNFTFDSLSHGVFSSQETSVPAPLNVARASVNVPLDSSFDDSEFPLTQESAKETERVTCSRLTNVDGPSSPKGMNLKLVSVRVSLDSVTSHFEPLPSQESEVGKRQPETKLQRFSVVLPSMDSSEEEHSLHLNRDVVHNDHSVEAPLTPKELPLMVADFPTKMTSPLQLPMSLGLTQDELIENDNGDVRLDRGNSPCAENERFELALSPESIADADTAEEEDFDDVDEKSKCSSVSSDRITENNELEIFEEFLSREIIEDESLGSNMSLEITCEIPSEGNADDGKSGSRSDDIMNKTGSVGRECSRVIENLPQPITSEGQGGSSPHDARSSQNVISPEKNRQPKKRTRRAFESILVTQEGSMELSIAQGRSLRKNHSKSSVNSNRSDENFASPASSGLATENRSKVTPVPPTESPTMSSTRKSSRILREKTLDKNEHLASSTVVSAPSPLIDQVIHSPRDNMFESPVRKPSSKGATRQGSRRESLFSRNNDSATSVPPTVNEASESQLSRRSSKRGESVNSKTTAILPERASQKKLTSFSRKDHSSKQSDAISLGESVGLSMNPVFDLEQKSTDADRIVSPVNHGKNAESPEPSSAGVQEVIVNSPLAIIPDPTETPKSTKTGPGKRGEVTKIVPRVIVTHRNDSSSPVNPLTDPATQPLNDSRSKKRKSPESAPQQLSDSRSRKRKSPEAPTQSSGPLSSENDCPQPAVRLPKNRKSKKNVNFDVKKSSTVINDSQADMMISRDISAVIPGRSNAAENEISEDSAPIEKFAHYVSTPYKKKSSMKTFAVPTRPAPVVKLRSKGKQRVSFKPGDSVIAPEPEDASKPKKVRFVENEADFSFGSALDLSEIPNVPSRAHSTPINETRRRASKILTPIQRKNTAQVQTTMSESSERASTSKSQATRASSSGTASKSQPLNESSIIDRPPDSFRSEIGSSVSAVPSLRRSCRTVTNSTVGSSTTEIVPNGDDNTLLELYKRRQPKTTNLNLPRPPARRGRPKEILSPETVESLGLPIRKGKFFKPANWVTKDLYNYLEKKLIDEFGTDTILISEKIVSAMHIVHVKIEKKHISTQDIDELKTILRNYKVCCTLLDFGCFIHKFTPSAFFLNVVSCGGIRGSTVPSNGGCVYDPL